MIAKIARKLNVIVVHVSLKKFVSLDSSILKGDRNNPVDSNHSSDNHSGVWHIVELNEWKVVRPSIKHITCGLLLKP